MSNKKKVDKPIKFCYCCQTNTKSFFTFPDSGQDRPYCNKCYINYTGPEREQRARAFLMEGVEDEIKKIKGEK